VVRRGKSAVATIKNNFTEKQGTKKLMDKFMLDHLLRKEK
jgi:hypothetical protein